MGFILETKDLTKTYSGKDAIRDVSLHIAEGEIYGLIGRNGAGKTTIMRIISGLSTQTSGSYSLFGKTGAEMRKLMRNVGVLIEYPGLYPNISAQENLKIKCIAMGIPYKGYIEKLLKTVGLENVSDDKNAGSFSLGMRQRLGIALALVGDPKIIILDEPINGLDPQGIVEVRQTLETLCHEQGITIMISSHILDELGKLANRYGIIHEGRLLDEFTLDELHARCDQFVRIKTNDNETALNVLSENGFTQTALDHDGHIRVTERLTDSAAMARAIVQAGLDLNEMFVNSVSLEDYYLSVTGGNHNG